MMYAKYVNDSVFEVYPQKPNWFYDNGDPVDDAFLASENIYPVEEPSIEDIELKDESEWTFDGSKVVQTYFTIIEPVVNVNPLLQKVVFGERNSWLVDGDNITKTYAIEDITPEEAQEYVDMNGCNVPDIDHDKHIEKPIQEWDYTNEVITKTYWEVIDDPTRENYSELFYTHSLNPDSEWIKSETTIQKTYVYTEQSIENIKSNLIEELAAYRYRIETGGFEWNGNGIHSTRDAQSTNNENNRKVKDGVITSNINLKTISGFISISPTQIEEIYLVQHNFVQECFDLEELVIVEINSQTEFNNLVTLYNNFNTKAWPSNALYLS